MDWKWKRAEYEARQRQRMREDQAVGGRIDTEDTDRFQQFARSMYAQARPGQWGAINELLSRRMSGESESASKIKGQILQAQMSEEMSKRIANRAGSSQSAALALAAARPVADKSAAAVEHSAMQRRIEQGQSINTFANASQKQEGFRSDLLKMGLSDAQAKLAADIQTRKNVFRDVLRERQKSQISDQYAEQVRLGMVGALGGAVAALGSMGSNEQQKKKPEDQDQGVLDVKGDVIQWGEGEEERLGDEFEWSQEGKPAALA